MFDNILNVTLVILVTLILYGVICGTAATIVYVGYSALPTLAKMIRNLFKFEFDLVSNIGKYFKIY